MKYLVGRQEVASYVGCSVWMVTAMVNAGLKCYNESKQGCPIRTTPENIDTFFDNNPDFIASRFIKKN